MAVIVHCDNNSAIETIVLGDNNTTMAAIVYCYIVAEIVFWDNNNTLAVIVYFDNNSAMVVIVYCVKPSAMAVIVFSKTILF